MRRVFSGVLDVTALALVGIVVRGVVLIIFRPTAATLDESWVIASMTFLDVVIVALVLFLVIPMRRRDRATPGQIAT